MKKLYLLFFVLITMLSCNEIDDGLYYYIDMEIVSINGECSLSNDKFHKPQMCNIILLKTINKIDGKILYKQINTCEPLWDIHIDTKWIYNHRVGDKVHFDYLRKDLMFEIYR
ncbi:hypothetical protein M0Q50_09935 [bacterium]|nr:hypothetical protein [bacterium]